MAEVHPNDIGLATFEDVGDVQKLLTAAKNVVAAINEIYQNAGDKDNAFGVQLYVDGENNVIIGQNNIVYGNNNLIVGSNNIIIGDNHTVFTNGTKIYSAPNLYPYSYDPETGAFSYSVFEENFVPSVKVGDTVAVQLSFMWYDESYTDMVTVDTPLVITKIKEINEESQLLYLEDTSSFDITPPDETHTVLNMVIISSFIAINDIHKYSTTKSAGFVFGTGTANGLNSVSIGSAHAHADTSFAVNSSSVSGQNAAAFNSAIANADYSFGANWGKSHGNYSAALNSSSVYSPYSLGTGSNTRIYGRAYKCVYIDTYDHSVTVEPGQNLTGITGKSIIILTYNKMNPVIYREGTVDSVSGDVIKFKGISFEYDELNVEYLFPEIYVFIKDTLATYSTANMAGGTYTVACNKNSLAYGSYVRALADGAVVFGKNGNSNEPYSIALANGVSPQATGFAFKVLSDGSVHADAAYTTPCADYAEFFEWADGNPDNEDRAGYFVRLKGDKIVKCGDFEKALGVVSATPAIVGDSSKLHWKNKFVTDDFGRIIYHDVLVPEQKDEEGNIITEEHTEKQPMINPEWDKTKNYIPRSERPEWSAVGVLGKLIVYDDGTLSPGDICRPGEGGIAVKSIENGYSVLKRVAKDKVLIWFKG